MKNKLLAQQGLTLLEVLIALAIVSIAFTAIIISTSQNIRNTQYLQTKMIAAWVSMSTINQVRANIIEIQDAEPLSGENETLGQKWFWKASKTPTPNLQIQKVEAQAATSESGKKIINLVSYIYNEKKK